MSAAAPSAAAAVPRTSSAPRSFPSKLLPAKGPNRVLSPQRAAINPASAPAKRSSPKKMKTKVPTPSPKDGSRAAVTPSRVPPKMVPPQPRPRAPSPTIRIPVSPTVPTLKKGPPQPPVTNNNTTLPTTKAAPTTTPTVKSVPVQKSSNPPRVSPQVLRTASTSSATGPIRRPSIPRGRPHPQGSQSLGGGSDTDTSTSDMPIPLPDNTRRGSSGGGGVLAGGRSVGAPANYTGGARGGGGGGGVGGTSSSSVPPSPIRARRIISSRNNTTEDDSPKQPRSANSSICFVLESHTKFVESAPNSRRPSPSSSRQSPSFRPRGAGNDDMSALNPSPIKALDFEEASQANIPPPQPHVEEKVDNNTLPPPSSPSLPPPPPSGAIVEAAMSSSSSSSSSSSIGEVVFRKRDRNNAKRSVSSTTDEDRDPQRRRRVGGSRPTEVPVETLRTLSNVAPAAEGSSSDAAEKVPPLTKDGGMNKGGSSTIEERVVEDPFGDGELYREHGITYAPPEPTKYKSAPPSSVANSSIRNADVDSDDSVLWAKKYAPVPAPITPITPIASSAPPPPPPQVADHLSHLKRLLESAQTATGDTSGLNHSMDDGDRSASVASSMVFEPIPTSSAPLPRPPTVPTNANQSSQKFTSVASVAVQATPPRPSRIETEELVTTSPCVIKEVAVVVPAGSVAVRDVGTVTVEKGLAMHLGPATRRPDPKGYAFLQKLREEPSQLKPRPSSRYGGVRSVRRPPVGVLTSSSSSASQASRRRGWDDSQPEVVPWEKQLRNAEQDEEDEKLRRRRDPSNPSGVVMHGCCVGERHQLFGPLGKALVAKLDELPAIVESHTSPPVHHRHDEVPRSMPPPPPQQPIRVSRSPPKTVERASFQQQHQLGGYGDLEHRFTPDTEQRPPSLVCRGLGWSEGSDIGRVREVPPTTSSSSPPPSTHLRNGSNAAPTPNEFLVAWRATRQAALQALQEVQEIPTTVTPAVTEAPTSVRRNNADVPPMHPQPTTEHPLPTTTSHYSPHGDHQGPPTVLSSGCRDGLCSTPPSEPQELARTVSPTPPRPASAAPYSYGTDNTIDAGLESFVLRGSASPPPSQEPQHYNQVAVSQPHGPVTAVSPSTSGGGGGGVLVVAGSTSPPPTPSHNGEDKETLLLTLLQQSMALQAEQLRIQQDRLERHQARDERRRVERERRKSTTSSGSVRACNSKEYEALKAYTAKIKELEVQNIHLKHKVAAKEDEQAIRQGTYEPTAAAFTIAANDTS